jgi:L-aminopeptidase/D-esterase-like protein
MPSITDIAGITVGHAHDTDALTGCTVVLPPAGTVAAADVRGGAPGTRETDLLNPTAVVEVIHAIVLCGGSAFGLAAASGVMQWLAERGIGLPTPFRTIPIVPAAVIYDLTIGQADAFPDAQMGYAACAAAGTGVDEGCVGAGIGATVGKTLGVQTAMKGGVGTWSETLPGGVTVGALVVCNAFGDVIEEANGRILAGARDLASGELADSRRALRRPEITQVLPSYTAQNTTLAVVATDARLSKAEASKLAQMAQDGLARTIRPVHTPLDGDTVFALATGAHPAPHLAILGEIAASVVARAIERSVLTATAMGGVPAARDMGGTIRELH